MFGLAATLLSALVWTARGDFPGQCDFKPTPCSCVYTDTITKQRMILDLGSASNADGSFKYSEQRGDDFYLYWFNACHDASLSGTGACENVLACQEWETIFSGLGRQTASQLTAAGSMIQLRSTHTADGIQRTMIVNLVCNNNYPENTFKAIGDQLIQYTYLFDLLGPVACPRSYDGDTVTTIELLLSPGWIMCIVAFVVLALYLAVGIVIQRMKFEKTGVEMVPNFTFWTALPTLVKEGAMFVVDKLKGCREGGGSGSYEKL